MKINWFEYWIWIPLTLAIKNRGNLYSIYSELFVINGIKLGKYKNLIER